MGNSIASVSVSVSLTHLRHLTRSLAHSRDMHERLYMMMAMHNPNPRITPDDAHHQETTRQDDDDNPRSPLRQTRFELYSGDCKVLTG